MLCWKCTCKTSMLSWLISRSFHWRTLLWTWAFQGPVRGFPFVILYSYPQILAAFSLRPPLLHGCRLYFYWGGALETVLMEMLGAGQRVLEGRGVMKLLWAWVKSCVPPSKHWPLWRLEAQPGGLLVPLASVGRGTVHGVEHTSCRRPPV